MASQVAIVNRALTKLGEARILSLSDDVEAARSADSMWDIVRDAELRTRRWKFSVTRASLAALVSTPDWGFTVEYQLPAGCLQLLQVNDIYVGADLSDYRNAETAMWRIEGRKILTDFTAPLKIRYVQSVTDTGQWDSAFTEAFACRLAAELSERLTQSNSKRELAWEEYKQAIRMAVRANALESAPEPLPDDAWMLCRL
jgi:hypothetical protein